jgi:hypothetical protein
MLDPCTLLWFCAPILALLTLCYFSESCGDCSAPRYTGTLDCFLEDVMDMSLLEWLLDFRSWHCFYLEVCRTISKYLVFASDFRLFIRVRNLSSRTTP